MPRARKKRTVNPWTRTAVKALRKHAGRTPTKKIARDLKRSEGAVRQKAFALDLSLRLR